MSGRRNPPRQPAATSAAAALASAGLGAGARSLTTDSLPYLLDAKLIRCFLAVHDLRNVSLAADALCLTQSATSKCILKLEDQLGVPLFHRGKDGMTPTTFGAALCRYARQIDLESRHARAEISAMKSRGFGAITIGIGPMWSVEVLPDAIASFHKARPGIHLRIGGGVPDTLMPDLVRGNLDLICGMMEMPDHERIAKVKLFEAELVVIARADHPLHRAQVVSPSDLLDYPWVRFTDAKLGNRLISEYFIRNGLEPPPCAVEVAALSSLMALLRTGAFIAAVSSTILAHARLLDLRRVQGVRVEQGAWRYQAGIAFRRDSPHPMIGEFIEHVRHAAGLQPGGERATHLSVV